MSTNDQLNSKTINLANKKIKDGDLAKSETAPLNVCFDDFGLSAIS